MEYGETLKQKRAKEKMTKIVENLEMNVTLLSNQIQEYPSINMWWHDCVVTPLLKLIIPQCLILFFIFSGLLYVQNWLGAAFCFAFIVSKIYTKLLTMSINLMHGYLSIQIQESYNRGVVDGKTSLTTN